MIETQAELEVTQARQQLLEQQQRAELEQKLKTSLTAAAVVHEIQQPLSSILLNCQSVGHRLRQMSSSEIPDPLLSNLDQLTKDGDRVAATMERMRMLLRNVETEHTTIDLATNVESSLLFLKNEIADHCVRPVLEGLDQPCWLNGDGAQLQMAIVNLIRNALQAMDNQVATNRRLLLKLSCNHNQIELTVADNGPGFPDHYRNNSSWELLKSTKATGMGIGLFIAETAATNHHGRLHIGRSAELGGAEVSIVLPISSKSHQPPATHRQG